ncbi:hypothetical protein D3C78_989970 [compost metagenome]
MRKSTSYRRCRTPGRRKVWCDFSPYHTSWYQHASWCSGRQGSSAADQPERYGSRHTATSYRFCHPGRGFVIPSLSPGNCRRSHRNCPVLQGKRSPMSWCNGWSDDCSCHQTSRCADGLTARNRRPRTDPLRLLYVCRCSSLYHQHNQSQGHN